VIKAFDAIRELRDAGVVVTGGFHSPMERECLDFLLRGDQPIIVCFAKGLRQPRLPAAWRKAIDGGRLLLVSPFADTVRRTTKAHAQTRNEFVFAIATAVLIPHASPGGKAEAIAREVVKAGKPLFTFDDPENQSLLNLGAIPYNIDAIRCELAGRSNQRTEQASSQDIHTQITTR
jgi:predicted Rossmann fold nucleotide-binding protein DprA/Smf involved in DNA uptake